MVIRAVVFDIGGVLEITPDLGVDRRWETRLGLPAGEINARLRDVWQGGSVGTITLDDVHEARKDRLGLDDQKLAQFMADLWREYVGTANRLNVPPGEMIFLDDVDACVAGARDAGINAIRYQDNAQAIAEIEKLLASP